MELDARPADRTSARTASEAAAELPRPAAPHARVERRDDGVWVVPGGASTTEVAPVRDASGAPLSAPRLRVVGPGRRERTWRRREAALETALADLSRELDTARLVERGSARLTDRIEADLARERAETAELRQAQARLLVTFGVLQRENLALRRKLELAEAALPALGDGKEERRTLRQRLFGTGRRKVDPPRRARR